MTIEQINLYADIAKILTSLFAFIGLFFTGFQIRLLYKSQESGNLWKRKEAAQDACWKYQDLTDGITQLEKFFNITERKKPISYKEFYYVFDIDKQERINVQRLLSFYNSLSRGITQGIYEEEVVRGARGTGLVRQYYNFSIYIAYIRKYEGKTDNYRTIEKMARKWDKKNILLSEEEIGEELEKYSKEIQIHLAKK